jgi:hypothetical protein
MAEVAAKYKELLLVERIFRGMKSVLATRPIFHTCDETIRGHVFCSFWNLILRKKLEHGAKENRSSRGLVAAGELKTIKLSKMGHGWGKGKDGLPQPASKSFTREGLLSPSNGLIPPICLGNLTIRFRLGTL